MKTALRAGRRNEEGAILAYFILLMIFAIALASVAAYVAQTTSVAHRRSDMTAANQYAQGGAVIACWDLNTAYVNTTSAFPASLTSLSMPYAFNSALSTSQQKVYERTISAPFTNQTIFAQIWVTNTATPGTAKIVALATVGSVTQATTVNVYMSFGYGAAILSLNKGTSDTSVTKAAGKAGNVVVNGGGHGGAGTGSYLVVDGGNALAVDANGQVNIDPTANVPPGALSKTNWGTANQIPDYTAQGTANSLFDFNRFIAVADLTTNVYYNTNSHNNHFSNVASFANAMRIATNHTLEGVIVVDINKADTNYLKAGDSATFTSGINVRGTLFYNFNTNDFGPADKLTVNASLNINAANLTGLVATNPATYPTAYPPVYSNSSNNPVNVNITSKEFANFTPTDDLPALMYSIASVDIHGSANVCGACYTPSYIEIENKGPSGTVQYFKGMMMMGQGIYYENLQSGCTSIISYDRKAADNLTTAGTHAKTVRVAYWQ